MVNVPTPVVAVKSPPSTVCAIDTSSWASGAGKSRNSTPFKIVNSPELTPTPSAIVTIAATAKPALRLNDRTA
jgi:hypothetical protein